MRSREYTNDKSASALRLHRVLLLIIWRIDLFVVNEWLPLNLALLIHPSEFVASDNVKGLASMNFLLTDAGFIFGEPKNWFAGRQCGMDIGVFAVLRSIIEFGSVLGDEGSGGKVVGVDVWSEKFLKLGGLWGFYGRSDSGFLPVGMSSGGRVVVSDLEIAWERLKERTEGVGEGNLVENSCDKEDDGQDQWSWSSTKSEETDHADFCEVDASEGLVQSTRIDHAFGINAVIVDKEEIVFVGEIEQ